jgi:hypothetical protein
VSEDGGLQVEDMDRASQVPECQGKWKENAMGQIGQNHRKGEKLQRHGWGWPRKRALQAELGHWAFIMQAAESDLQQSMWPATV